MIYQCNDCKTEMMEGRLNRINIIFYPETRMEKDDVLLFCLKCFRKFKKMYGFQ